MSTTKACSVIEELAGVSTSKVDRDKKVIRGVKVLGLESRNPGRVLGLSPRDYGDAVDRPYRYSGDAVKAAIPLYEGMSVNIDHPASSFDDTGRRVITGGSSINRRFGRLVNVRDDGAGLSADLEYLESHPQCGPILEMAERMPEQLAMSHHAYCDFKLIDGQVVATVIKKVQSVDLIGEKPGTTKSLFESQAIEEKPVPKTLKQTLESTKCKKWHKFVKEVIEMDAPMGDMPMPDDGAGMDSAAEDADPQDQMMDAVQGMIAAVVSDTTLDSKAKLAKISQYLDLLDGVNAANGSTDTPAAGTDAAAAAAESLARENKALKAREKAREILESKGVAVTAMTVKAVAALESDADMLAYASELAAGGQPRPQSRETRREEREINSKPVDGKALANRWKS